MTDEPRDRTDDETVPETEPAVTGGGGLDPDPRQIGPYRILSVLGEGGMGVVYRARQTAPVRRDVALKLIKLGMDTRDVIARFESERQALALMNHPNVARVFDAGATDSGRPYFVMEYVQGVPITRHCDDQKLTIEQRLELFMRVCEAVQHAHQKGIIHRDIKPSNVLVEYADGRAAPKIIDFGVAKATNRQLTEKTLFTRQGQLIGTPEYMSPEQAETGAQDIDTRSDIYSLGVLLYELLTGALPFDPKSLRGAGLTEIHRIIRESEPPKPSTKVSSLVLDDESMTAARNRRSDLRALTRRLRGDLDWIVMKCLEKDRARRYETANALALELRRHLSNEPVLAGPPSPAYRLKKFVRRNRGGVAAAGVIALVLLAATGISIGFALSEAEQRRIAQDAQRRAQDSLRLAEQREKEAAQARDNLKIVVDFQQSMLSEIDAQRMGRGIFADLRDGIRKSLSAESATPETIAAAIGSFDAALKRVNATDLALNVVDEHVLRRAVQTIERDFADQPLVEAALRQTVGDTYEDLGLYAQATPQMERALALRRRVLGADHPDTLLSMNNMGLLLELMGRNAEAEGYCREALEGKRRVLGDDHPDTLTSINNMGVLLQSMGRPREAERYFRAALDGRRRVLGTDHPDTLQSINNTAALLESIGKLTEAEAYFREALEGNRRVLGADHPETLASINNMGFLLESMGKFAEAEPYYREALEGHRRVLGDDHLHTLSSIINMAALLESMGKLQEAEPYYREALKGCRGALGDDHPATLVSINNMGALLQSMGKLVEAEPYYRAALEGLRRVLGADHPRTLASINNMGHLLRSMGKLAEAEPYLRKALEGRRRVLGADHPDTLQSINNMGALLESMGKLAEAEALFAAAVDGARRSPPEGHWRIGTYLGGHGSCLAKLKRYADAETALLEAYGILKAALGAEHKRTVKLIESLADLYDAWGKPDKAAEWRAKLPKARGPTGRSTQREKAGE